MNSGITERELRVAEAMAEWPPMSAVQRESTPLHNEHLVYINFIDEDGEVSRLQTTKNEGTSHLFDTYARHYHTPFFLSRVMYEFTYNGELIPLDVYIGSIGIDNNAIVYVKAKLPSRTDFNNRIVPNIPVFVKNHPRCFINQKVRVITGDESSVLCTVNDYSIDTGSFIIEYSGGDTLRYDRDQFITLLQDYYSNSNLNGFGHDIKMYVTVLWSICKTQVDKIDPNQSLDKPNAIKYYR